MRIFSSSVQTQPIRMFGGSASSLHRRPAGARRPWAGYGDRGGGRQISGGEKQRLAIARALLRRPELLIFDEATSSLDSITEEEISQTIREVASTRDAITILIAHRLSTVLHADCIYVLERGRIAESAAATTNCWKKEVCITLCGGSRLAKSERSSP